jgi:D-glucosaminate-specific PTS system IIB component
MIRVDFRLIHGQVITKWIKMTGATEIVIVDNPLAADDFMKSIYTMSAPPGVNVSVETVDNAIKKINNNYYKDSKIFVLFKTIDVVYEAFQKNYPFDELQIGGLGSDKTRKVVYGPITLNKVDYDQLVEMQKSGVRVYLHQVPDEPIMEFTKLIEKRIF